VGNSSSGIYEAAVLRTPAVDVGDRQKSRLRSAAVWNPPPNEACPTSRLDLRGPYALSEKAREP
jgi:hypothetical protein